MPKGDEAVAGRRQWGHSKTKTLQRADEVDKVRGVWKTMERKQLSEKGDGFEVGLKACD